MIETSPLSRPLADLQALLDEAELPFSERRRPVLMKRDEVRSVQQAAHEVGVCEKTVRRWCSRYGIGRQAGQGAPLEISVIALHMVHHGDWAALALLRRDRRDHPDVRRYFDFVGLPA